jgi:Mor family transcriptional regulator
MRFNELASIIGQEAAFELCRATGGRSMYIPVAPMLPEVRERILELADDYGFGVWEIQKETGLRVRKIRRVLRDAGGQP